MEDLSERVAEDRALLQMQIALNNMLANDLELCDWALKNEANVTALVSRLAGRKSHLLLRSEQVSRLNLKVSPVANLHSKRTSWRNCANCQNAQLKISLESNSRAKKRLKL